MVLKFFGGLQNLIDFGFVDTLYIAQFLFGGHDNTRYGAESAGFKFGDISGIDSVFLQFLDLDEIGLFDIFEVFFEFFFDLFLFVFGFFFLLHGASSQK